MNEDKSGMVILGYDRKRVLRTRTGYRIFPNKIPVLVLEPEYIFDIPILVNPEPEFRFLMGFLFSDQNLPEFIFPINHFIKKMFLILFWPDNPDLVVL